VIAEVDSQQWWTYYRGHHRYTLFAYTLSQAVSRKKISIGVGYQQSIPDKFG